MTTTTLPTCALCRHEPRIGLVCWRCHDRLRDLLDPRNEGTTFDPARPDDPYVAPSIPVLLWRLDPAPGTSGPAVGGPSAFGSRPPANLEVIAMRDRRSTMLGLVDPQRPPLVIMRALARRLDVADTPGALYGALDRLVRQPWVDEAYRELRALSARLRPDDTTRPVGTCRALVDDDGNELTPHEAAAHLAREQAVWRCAWPLYTPDLPPRAPDEPVTLPVLRCGSCGHRYTGSELVELGRQDVAA